MPRARLVDPARCARSWRTKREALRTIRHLQHLAAHVDSARSGADGRQLATLLRNGAWAVEDLYKMHPKEGKYGE